MAKIGESKYESRAPSHTVGVQVDTSQLAAFSEKLKQWPAAIENAMVNAINDTLTQGRRKAAQLMTEKYNILQRDVVPHVKMLKAHRNQEFFSGELQIHPAAGRPGLGKFGGRQVDKKGGGVTYTTLKGRPKQFIRGAFQAPRRGKPIWIAIQAVSHLNKGKNKAEKTQKRRTRLHFLQGISVWGMFASLSNREEVNKRMSETFMFNLQEQVNFQFLARTDQIPGTKFDRRGWIRRSGKRPANP